MSHPRPQLRAEATSPVAGTVWHAIDRSHRILFLHPNYRAPTNVLLDLLAPDGPEGGLDFSFAHTACAIIAGNRWDGYFTKESETPVRYQHGDILPVGEYYFQVDGFSMADPYPISPTFREWSFPHDNLPPCWRSAIHVPTSAPGRSFAPSNFSFAIIAQNRSCRMSDHEECAEVAHLCPKAELDWFHRNGMSRYKTSPVHYADHILDDTANELLLRQDLHTQFDANKFVFLPKREAGDTDDMSIVTHLLVPIQELGALHHNVRLKPIRNVDTVFLFVRFAWAMFKFLDTFLAGGVGRKIFGISSTDGSPQMISGDDCKKIVTRIRSQRTTKTSKRKHTADDDEVGLADAEAAQRSFKRQRLSSPTFRYSGTPETAGSPDAVFTASEEEPQTPQTQAQAQAQAQAEAEAKAEPKVQFSGSKVDELREEWLKSERQRSDPENTWEREKTWVKKFWDGKTTMGSHEAKRFYEFYGMEERELE